MVTSQYAHTFNVTHISCKIDKTRFLSYAHARKQLFLLKFHLLQFLLAAIVGRKQSVISFLERKTRSLPSLADLFFGDNNWTPQFLRFREVNFCALGKSNFTLCALGKSICGL